MEEAVASNDGLEIDWALGSELDVRTFAAFSASGVAHAGALAVAYLASIPLGMTPVDDDAASRSVPVSLADAVEGENADDEIQAGHAPQVCGPASNPKVGRRVFEILGPDDNPDPHIARVRAPSDAMTFVSIGPLRDPLGGDRSAPTAPWGRDDSLGRDARSASNIVPGLRSSDLASCWGAPPPSWSCSGEPPTPPTVERLGLAGIGDELRSKSTVALRTTRVVFGAIQVAANVPAYVIRSAVAASEIPGRARACYERALADEPMLAGRLDIVLRIRGEEVSVDLAAMGGMEAAPAVGCCVERAHDDIHYDLPTGTRANARYAITFGRPRTGPGL